MATVHRNGRPPPRVRHKVVLRRPTMEFSEDLLVGWARSYARGATFYDFTVFNGSRGKLNQEVEVTVWFQNKSDAQDFRTAWLT